MKTIIALMIALFLLMQYKLWFGDGSIPQVVELRQRVEEQRDKNEQARQRNMILATEVDDLKTGLDVIEELARSDLGMVKEGETFIHIVDSKPSDLAEK